MEPVKAAIYLRLSLDKNGDGLGVERQREDANVIIATRGWTAVGEYVDNNITASDRRKDRPGYNALLDDYEAGKFNAIVSYDLDRLTRQPRQLEDWIEAAESRGLALVTANGEADLTTDAGRLFARIKLAVARSEIERKAARQRRAAKQRAEKGKPWWPSRPFGYTDNHGTALHPEESEFIADAYRQLLVGSSLYAIAKDWNDASIKTPKGNIWRGAQVRQLLIAPRNAGRRYYDGVDVGEASWPAIVDVETWRQAKAILEDPVRRSGASRGRKHLLTGIALCGVCGNALGSGIASANNTQVYVCKGNFCVSRNAAETDEWVIQHIVERLTRADALTVLMRDDQPDIDALRGEAATLRARLEELAGLVAEGVMTVAQFRTANERVKIRLAEVEKDMYDADAFRALDGLMGVREPREAFDSVPLARQRTVVNLLATVTVKPTGRGKVFDPTKVDITFKGK